MAIGYRQQLEAGDTIGGLEVLGYSHTDTGGNRWVRVQCFCGKVFKANSWKLKSKHTKSCGCLRKRICTLRNVNTPYKERCKRATKGWITRRLGGNDD